ncbi:hypothetical protein DBR32_02350 [Taibaiella sp. KBW10]|uniref:hypothetical protein n=1 Tax=Taibaiella sp. KBW10 TaxID=2153357 RepID=UPI000F5ACD7C|nr:hypothetical protein [Taibaiella sp. KBW10]RQO32465.1 hypothetical protein DBR32_02350 [Taibaiella sp. KBW10]
MKKVLFVIAFSLFSGFIANAVTPVSSGTIPCMYTASVRHYNDNPTTGVRTYYGLYYYFNSVADAHTYILEQYPPVPFIRYNGANVTCTTVIGPGPVGS